MLKVLECLGLGLEVMGSELWRLMVYGLGFKVYGLHRLGLRVKGFGILSSGFRHGALRFQDSKARGWGFGLEDCGLRFYKTCIGFWSAVVCGVVRVSGGVLCSAFYS